MVWAMTAEEFRTSTGRGRRLYRLSVDTFVSILRTIKGKPSFTYRMTDADVAGWDAWVTWVGADRVGEDLIRRWAEYGFQSWFNDGAVKDYNHAVRYNWIFNGGTAVKRWLALPEEKRVWCVRTSLKRDFGVRRTRKPSSDADAALFTTPRPQEEAMKKRFYGTQRGVAWCVANTTLYNHRSSLCVVCKFKNDCLLTLKRDFPRIARARGYAVDKSVEKDGKENIK